MDPVVQWAALIESIAPFAPEGTTGRPRFALQSMPRIHFMQRGFRERHGADYPALERRPRGRAGPKQIIRDGRMRGSRPA